MPDGAHVLDVGCADGALFRQAGSLVKSGIGIDPDEPSNWLGSVRAQRGRFPDALDDPAESFDAITMLESSRTCQTKRARTVRDGDGGVKPGGRMIITVPAPLVDRLLDIGIRLHLLHGMDAESHHGFDPRIIAEELSTPLMRLLRVSRFEMGLNHLFVFERQE